MGDLLTIENLLTLLSLTLLQAVLGFDNLLYISMESKRVALERQGYVRRMGVGIAIGLRIVLLFVLMQAVEAFADPFWKLDAAWVHFEMSGHSVIVLIGGGFILWTAMKEIFHMMIIPPEGGDAHAAKQAGQRSVASAITWIVLMNLVFSFDSILAALALTDVFMVMATAIVISGVLMIWLADTVSRFLQKNRMYEVLGLFVLLLVGVMLLSEGGHLMHLELFGSAIEPMAKSTFYFVIAALVLVDLVQGRYQRKLLAQNERMAAQSPDLGESAAGEAAR